MPMIELPEAHTLARQLTSSLIGRTVTALQMNQSPHKFAFYYGNPNDYPSRFVGTTFTGAMAYGGQVELSFDQQRLVLSDGVNLRYHTDSSTLPAKHQLLMTFDDGSALTITIAMYGMIYGFEAGTFQNSYYLIAHTTPSVYSEAFTLDHFKSIIDRASPKLSLKALLATEQRIPGLGNGVLQDILFRAKRHPKSKVLELDDAAIESLYHHVVDTLTAMRQQGGRDTEKDLFGNQGGYTTLLSAKTLMEGCPDCGGELRKEAYMGGSIYFCPHCQPI
jgi:formamidopyrimidine-DNA glycosylase